MIFVISPKNVYAAKRLLRAAGIMNQALRIMDLNDLIARRFKVPVNYNDVLYVRNPYFRGKPDYLPQIINLAKKFKAQGGRVVDWNITRGELGLGKWRDYQKLKKAGLPVPETKLLKAYPPAIRQPLILKWIYGFKGRGTFLINTEKDFKKIPPHIPENELMAQEYIEAKYEYKVITVGYTALPVVLRFKIKDSGFRVDFRKYSVIPNESDEPRNRLNTGPTEYKGSFPPSPRLRRTSHPPAQIFMSAVSDEALAESGRDDRIRTLINICQRAAKTLGRELAKVDILEDNDGKFYILEVNRFPGLESFEELTGYNAAEEFVKYLSGG